MIKPIYNALDQLIKFQGSATITELVKVSGKKPIEVLTVINDNDRLVIKRKDEGKIIGLVRNPVATKTVDQLWRE